MYFGNVGSKPARLLWLHKYKSLDANICDHRKFSRNLKRYDSAITFRDCSVKVWLKLKLFKKISTKRSMASILNIEHFVNDNFS